MSIHIDALREIAANHGWGVCDLAADEIEDMEKAYELLFEENSKNKQRAAEEAAIVDKIWDLFGRPSYKDLNGRSIYDLITDVQQRAAVLEKALHYPKCWDTAAYPTALDVIKEIYPRCSECEALNGGG